MTELNSDVAEDDDEIDVGENIEMSIDLLEAALTDTANWRELVGEALDHLRDASDVLGEDFMVTAITCDDGGDPDEEHEVLLAAFEPDEVDPDTSLAALNVQLRACKRPARAEWATDEEELADEQ